MDGHAFVRDAVARGAACVVVEDRGISDLLARNNVPHYLVEDVLSSMQSLAREYRRCLEAKVVAITGSGGKTTTKEYAAAILKSRYRVHMTAGNYNNMIGVPKTVLDARLNSELLVCEVGANQTGEVAFLSGIVHPHVALITNIGDAHIGYFGSRDNIAVAKSELIRELPGDAIALLPRDDDYFDFLSQQTSAEVKTFGVHSDADYVLSDRRATRSGQEFVVSGEPVALKAFGSYNAMNACAAFAVGDICGVSPRAMRDALSEVAPMRGRGAIHRVSGALVIDESYNASPASLTDSLSALCEFEATRRIAVLGDMAELGDFSEEKHSAVGRHIASLPISEVYWVGKNGKWVEAAMAASNAVAVFASVEDAAKMAQRLEGIGEGDVILVKASRSVGLDGVVDALIRNTRS